MRMVSLVPMPRFLRFLPESLGTRLVYGMQMKIPSVVNTAPLLSLDVPRTGFVAVQ